MAQDANKITRPLAAPSDTAHLRQQIAETRAGMTHTIDAIQDRVNPRSVMNRTVASIRSTMLDRMRNFVDTAGSAAGYVAARTGPARDRAMRETARAIRETRQNPARAAMIGAAGAAAMCMMIRSFRNGRRRSDYLYDQAF